MGSAENHQTPHRIFSSAPAVSSSQMRHKVTGTQRCPELARYRRKVPNPVANVCMPANIYRQPFGLRLPKAITLRLPLPIRLPGAKLDGLVGRQWRAHRTHSPPKSKVTA
jgi:hypothetical protein